MADALDSLYKAFQAQLNGAIPWGNEVYPDAAPSWGVRPLVIYNNGGMMDLESGYYLNLKFDFIIDPKRTCIH